MKLTSVVVAVTAGIILSLSGIIYFQQKTIQSQSVELSQIKLVIKQTKEIQQKNKKKADAENKKSRAALDLANQRLRNTIANSNLSTNPTGSDRICFDREEFSRTIRGFAEIAGKGAKAINDLDSAKKWAQNIN